MYEFIVHLYESVTDLGQSVEHLSQSVGHLFITNGHFGAFSPKQHSQIASRTARHFQKTGAGR